MDTRIKLNEVKGFVKNAKLDYKSSSKEDKKHKKSSYLKTLNLLLLQLWCGITAPFIYPIWYLFRESITNKIYKGTSWVEVHRMVEENKIEEVKTMLKKNGKILYWFWTFGDLKDPLGRGEIPSKATNNFKTRYYENAIRNPRFTINYTEFRTGTIVKANVVMDTRDFSNQHSTEGIGNVPDGIYFKWMVDVNGKWVFIYEDNNKENMFYYGYVALKEDIGHNGRFEIGYRANNNSKSSIYAGG